MARNNYTITSLAEEDSIRLEIDGVSYPVVSVAAAFAINEIPRAQCVMAIGWDADTGVNTQIHKDAYKLNALAPAKIYAKFNGEATLDGQPWPSEQVIFEGYYIGFGYQKNYGQVQLVVYLSHWLMDMAFSSALSSVSAPGTPAELTYNAVFRSGIAGAFDGNAPTLAEGGSSSSQPATFLSTLINIKSPTLTTTDLDIWGSTYLAMVTLASNEAFSPPCTTGDATASLSTILPNDRALKALRRFEGKFTGAIDPSLQPTLDYKYSKALTVPGSLWNAAAQGIGAYLGQIDLASLNMQTIWSFMAGNLCPAFGLQICPMIDRAVVVADTPGWRGGNAGEKYWRMIGAEEYESINLSGHLDMPLRAVVCSGFLYNAAGTGSFAVSELNPCLGGVYISDASQDAMGTVLYTSMPAWIAMIGTVDGDVQVSTGLTENKATNTATTPGADDPPKKDMTEIFKTSASIANDYAHVEFIRNTLRGRFGTLSGRLRFDIAPGSHVEVEGSPEGNIARPELLVNIGDKLASSTFGQVIRVTYEIDAQRRTASTTLLLGNLRNEKENLEARTSISGHPFFGDNVTAGAPLRPEFDLKDKNIAERQKKAAAVRATLLALSTITVP